MFQSKYLRAAKTRKHILSQLSPGIAGELALEISKKWLFVEDLHLLVAIRHENALEERDLFAELALLLRANVFPPGESCPLDRVYVASYGRALYGGLVKTVGGAWGVDEFYSAGSLRLRFPAVASGYLQAFSIEGGELRSALAKYPKASARVRKSEARWILRRGVVRLAEEASARAGQQFFGRRHTLLARAALSGTGTVTMDSESDRSQSNLISAAMRFTAKPANGSTAEQPRKTSMSGSVEARSGLLETKPTLEPPPRPPLPQSENFFSKYAPSALSTRLAGADPVTPPNGVPSSASYSGEQLAPVVAMLRETQKRQSATEGEVKRLAAGVESVKGSLEEILKVLKSQPPPRVDA